MKQLLAALLSLAIFSFAHAAADPDRYLLNVATLQKIKAVNVELSKANLKGLDDDDGNDDKSVEEMARELDSHPKVKASLARHGLTSMEYAMSMHAILAAATYLMFESSMDKKKAASLFASYPKERQANIELLRKNAQHLK
ncbi:hypothetical protein D3870_01665 [Noviherbaspirillum cavernae]|uniref:Uncharacterized protein n=1 Tax=Noviherbaspirillum cavernae TaxID=2320862 RepID=A0A418WXQ4_9BURK|nr:hypothetical protein [Noviherbaspirillum cavernae]RJG04903.1 hypothetical protein D3870_01665 [Noviherbaspirillum cavernae]